MENTNVIKKPRKIEEKRLHTPAKITIRGLEDWIAAKNGRAITIGWKWCQVNRYDRSGVISATQDGVEVCRKVYQNGNMHLPNEDFHLTNSGGHRHRALQALLNQLQTMDAENAMLDDIGACE